MPMVVLYSVYIIDIEVMMNSFPAQRPTEVLAHPKADGVAISANTDIEAALTWLKNTADGSVNTYRSYSKELRRFMVWLETRSLTFCEVSVEEMKSYFDLLRFPSPNWIIPRSKKEITLKTQLIKPGGLSASSVSFTRRVLINLYRYLQNAGYLTANPVVLTGKGSVVKELSQQRYLDLATWQWSWNKLVQYENDCLADPTLNQYLSKAVRYRWVFALLYHTGMRAEEAAFAAMGDVFQRDGFWSLHVIGKGNKARHITINSKLMSELVRYRNHLYMPTPYPSPKEDTPLIRSIQSGRKGHLSTRLLSGLIREIVTFLLADCPEPHLGEQLEHMTTHWLRHTNATHRLMAGASLHSTSDELGHSNIQTTRIYAKTSDKHRQEDAEKLAQLSKLAE
jgi:site-specific recombinase XerD